MMKDVETVAPDVYSVKVVLRPLSEAVVSPAHGYQVYALLLNILRMSAPSLAEELHDLDSVKPFTVSSLWERLEQAEADLEWFPSPHTIEVV